MGGATTFFDSALPRRSHPEFDEWSERLKALPPSGVSILVANPTADDATRVLHLQVACSPISVKSVVENLSTIAESRVLIAEINAVHVGFCVSLPGTSAAAPLFIKVIGVVPEAQRRGAGTALLTTAAEAEPSRDIAFAAQDSNCAALALNERFAESIGSTLERVVLGTFRDRDLGISRGFGYRSWLIRRP